ncbi:aminotransferase class IV [Flavobacterium sp. NKUCC04_CG]|uniref:aminotransferase class IV n=1 Tax=Flavobacterium sp. NKUCC04_CG TaxID=2842121 RepID=UPI001C5B2DD8|nr:aminotransferase class IV [Flavobacterium sp. NKUCC04_CG]MBW3519414.1 aminotransferase class IV [Flavobacterium sp. NKUCC04_CG]
MINSNGQILSESNITIENNRAFLYGDAIFETIKVLDQKVLFLEDHYFRLMSSMRVVRMEIPMNFTMEYFEEQILLTVAAFTTATPSFRVRFTVFRDAGGKYMPTSNKTSFIVQVESLDKAVYTFDARAYEIELYKDFYVTKHLLSTLKTNNRMIQITGSIFASENGYDNCLLLNDEKNVVEALNANIFVVKDKVVKTPPISDGCIKGVMRKQLIELIAKMEGYEFVEASVSPFELQKADEIFLSNCILGIQAVSKYRKKDFTSEFSQDLLKKLNAKIRLS